MSLVTPHFFIFSFHRVRLCCSFLSCVHYSSPGFLPANIFLDPDIFRKYFLFLFAKAVNTD